MLHLQTFCNEAPKLVLTRFYVAIPFSISYRHALTAAHCAITVEHHEAFIGSRKRHNRASTPLVLNISWVRNHPLYNKARLDSDISIIGLESTPNSVAMKEIGIFPIRIRWDMAGFPSDKKIFGLGFGKTEAKANGAYPLTLRNGSFFKVDIRRCQQLYFPHAKEPGSLCAKGVNMRTACVGDSGGPIVWYQHNSREGHTESFLIAVISGIRVLRSDPNHDCLPGAAVMAARVSDYKEWISNHVGTDRRW